LDALQTCAQKHKLTYELKHKHVKKVKYAQKHKKTYYLRNKHANT